MPFWLHLSYFPFQSIWDFLILMRFLHLYEISSSFWDFLILIRFPHLYEIFSSIWDLLNSMDLLIHIWDFLTAMRFHNPYDKCSPVWEVSLQYLPGSPHWQPSPSPRTETEKIHGVIFQGFFYIQRLGKIFFFSCIFLDIFMCLKVYQLNDTNNMCSQQGHCCMFQFWPQAVLGWICSCINNVRK